MHSEPKIIFLDIDGPMVPGRALLLPGNSPGYWGWTFDPVAVSMLNFLDFAIPELKLVLSSHRWGANLKGPYKQADMSVESREFWEYHFLVQGITASFHDDWITPRTMHDGEYVKRNKCFEVEDWLEAHSNVKQFVTLEDDLNGGQPVNREMRKRYHLYAESYADGITQNDFKGICSELGLKDPTAKYLEYSKTFLPVG